MPMTEAQMKQLTAQIVKLLQEKRYDKAEQLALSKLSPAEDNVRGLQIFSSIYRATQRFDASEVCCRRALWLKPDDAATHTNYGNLLTDLNRLDEAVLHTGQAVRLEPENETILRNHICPLREGQRFAEAEPYCDQLLALKNNDSSALYLSAQIYLYQNKYAEGWRRYEQRFYQPQYAALAKLPMPCWRGEIDTQNKSLLIIGEQGFGDMMLMTRFFPELARRFKRVALLCKPALHRLFAKLPVQLLTEGQPVPDLTSFDYYISSMSIPDRVQRDWTLWPASVLLHAAETAPFKIKKDNRLKVGIVWSGSVTFGGNAKRAVGLDRFLQLAAAVPEARFFSFQKGPGEDELRRHGSYPLIHVGNLFDDFSATAAAIRQMDLLVMTDTSLVHLCGIFGVPVVDLLNYLPYWLYGTEASTTPLYNSVSFLRQRRPGDWDDVFERVAQILISLAGKKQERPNMGARDILTQIRNSLGVRLELTETPSPPSRHKAALK